MGPYLPKMNALAFKTLNLLANSPRVQVGQPGESDGGHVVVAYVSHVQMTVGTHMFGAWDSEVLDQVDVQSLLPGPPPVMLMNLSMLRTVQALQRHEQPAGVYRHAMMSAIRRHLRPLHGANALDLPEI